MDLGKIPTVNRFSTKITVSPRVDIVFVLYYVDFLGILEEHLPAPTCVRSWANLLPVTSHVAGIGG